MKNNNVLSIFDFDKTLIKGDSFRIFSLLASDNTWKKIIVFFLALCHKCQFISNSCYKESVLRTVWISKQERDKEIFFEKFYKALKKIENKRVLNALKKHLEFGDKVVVISASPLFYLEPYVKLLSDNVEVLGSRFRSIGGGTEFFNLYGDQKMMCARAIIQKMKPNILWVYTDHISDLPLIKLADRVRLINPSDKFVKRLNQLKIDCEIY
jgi:phosphoserine phosphatase